MTATHDPQTIGVALIGAGMIAKTHVAAISATQGKLRLDAVVSRNPDKARGLSAHYAGVAPVFTSDLAAVAANPDIHFAIVATPPNVRREVIEVLAKAGKHILLEKPVARTLAEALDVVELCEEAGVTLGVVFQHRVRAPAIAAAELVASGQLGKLGLVEISVPLWRDQSYYDELGRGTYARDGGGVMMTNAIHSIDLVQSLTGPVTRVQAMTATTSLHQMEAEDFAVAGLQFGCGAVGSFVASTAMFPHRTEVIRLHFDNASLRIDKDTLAIDWRDGRHEVVGQDAGGKAVVPLAGGKHAWHQAVIEDFAQAIQKGAAPLASGREALASQAVIAAIEDSSRTGNFAEVPQV